MHSLRNTSFNSGAGNGTKAVDGFYCLTTAPQCSRYPSAHLKAKKLAPGNLFKTLSALSGFESHNIKIKEALLAECFLYFGAGNGTRTRGLLITIVVRHLTNPCKSRVLTFFSDATMPFVAKLLLHIHCFLANYIMIHNFRL